MKTVLAGIAAITGLVHMVAYADGPYGHYVGQVVAEFRKDGRTMELVEPFEYVSPSGTTWDAPKGSIVDGASIPQWAWSTIGGPFEGKYRDASVIHDVACIVRTRPWQDVHYAFYTAMLASGVSETKAKVMYAAVYLGGPRWSVKKLVTSVPELQVNSTLRKLQAEVGANNRIVASVAPQEKLEGAPTPTVELKKLHVEVIPDERRLTAEEFEKLKAKIEKGSMSLEEIRSYHPAP